MLSDEGREEADLSNEHGHAKGGWGSCPAGNAEELRVICSDLYLKNIPVATMWTLDCEGAQQFEQGHLRDPGDGPGRQGWGP